MHAMLWNFSPLNCPHSNHTTLTVWEILGEEVISNHNVHYPNALENLYDAGRHNWCVWDHTCSVVFDSVCSGT